MKFECSVDIGAPIDRVVALFNDPTNFKDWQDGFVSYEPISGKPRQAGAKSLVRFVNKGHMFEMTETIQEMKLPAETTALYEYKHGVNTMITRFIALPGGKTRYIAGVGYMKPIGFLPTLMAGLMPGMAEKHNRQWAENFKAFAEKKLQGQKA
jgi:hypothetical protein